MRNNNYFLKVLLPLLFWACLTPKVVAQGWPSGYEGVMLQGFYWDSYDDTKWTNLTAQADELSQYFDLIWIPNSGYCGAGNNMGYMPQYWFRHNSSFGTEAELREMIETYKVKGTGFVADVVINHRNGVTNWTDFPTETDHHGVTWTWGPWAICSDDEVANASGQATPTGAPDTGDNFDGCRDLDHTNETVQDGIKAYIDFLLNDLGYEGVRYDMVKGYAPQYTGIYNEDADPLYSVGECWDDYDVVTAWLEGTKRNGKIMSAAFDFPGKYAMNEAFASGDYSKLVWARYGTTNQPAGLIHMDGYCRFAVTFVDNHDTYRDGSKFTGNVVAANAFMLCNPGTPCVFLPHWTAYKEELKKLIEIRKAVGINNESVVNVLETAGDIYVAEVTGTKGSLLIKVGSRYSYDPSGYTGSDIVASGDDYCIWTKVDVNSDVPVVKISPEAGLYEGGTVVTITVGNVAEGKTAAVYYTLDGTQPSVSNGVKAESGVQIRISQKTTVKAMAVVDGVQSSVVTATYYTEISPISVYLEKSTAWNTVNYYAWNVSGSVTTELLGKWPGTPVTAIYTDKDGKDYYVYTFDASVRSLNVIFNDGTNQTQDIMNVTESTFYRLNATSGKIISVTDITSSVHTGKTDVAAAKTGVSVYPNPVTDVVRIQSSVSVEKVFIYDMNGRLVLQSEYPLVNVFGLSPGFYMYQVVLEDGGISYGKFVKQ